MGRFHTRSRQCATFSALRSRKIEAARAKPPSAEIKMRWCCSGEPRVAKSPRGTGCQECLASRSSDAIVVNRSLQVSLSRGRTSGMGARCRRSASARRRSAPRHCTSLRRRNISQAQYWDTALFFSAALIWGASWIAVSCQVEPMLRGHWRRTRCLPADWLIAS